jgi:opacity protein-like surface antigen
VFKKRFLLVIVFLVIIFSLYSGVSYCEVEEGQEEAGGIKEFSVLTGWGKGKLKYNQGDYEIVPLHFQIGFDVTSWLDKMNIEQRGNLRFLLEPFLNTVTSPSTNIETGNNFVIKYSHPITQKVSAYLEGVLGLLYTTQHTAEQGMQFNFSQQGGVGITYLFTENKAINFGFRRRHFSNADIKQPNSGIDMDYFLLGVSIFY